MSSSGGGDEMEFANAKKKLRIFARTIVGPSFHRMVWPVGANRTRSRNIDRVARVSPLVRSGISPRQKCTRRVSRETGYCSAFLTVDQMSSAKATSRKKAKRGGRRL